MLLGIISFSVTVAGLVYLQHPLRVLPKKAPDNNPFSVDVADWNNSHPELTGLIEALKKQKKSLDKRQRQLNELAVRLQSERSELDQVTQTVYHLQHNFDQSIVQVRAAEAANLKRLAKMYGAMDPTAAATVLGQMQDDQVVKVLMFMRDSQAAQILQSVAQQSSAQAKRVADISEKLRLALDASKKNRALTQP